MSRRFFAGPVLDVATNLLGCTISSRGPAGRVAVRITEVEAYAGESDPASHAFRGPTPRTAVMFGRPGHLYVYFTYGMHWCANLVCGPDGTASAVLLRAGAVEAGADLARSRAPGPLADRDLARGPARLARALGLTGADTGLDVCAAGALLRVHPPALPAAPDSIRTGPRVGITAAADRPWRFWLADEPTVSAFRAGGRRAPGR